MTQVPFECPSCTGREFQLYYLGEEIVINGKIWLICRECGSWWNGSMSLEEGHLKPHENHSAPYV